MAPVNKSRYSEIGFKSTYVIRSVNNTNYIEVWDSHIHAIRESGIQKAAWGNKLYFTDRQIGVGTTFDEDKYFWLGKTVCPVSNKQVTRIDPDFKHNGKYTTIEGTFVAMDYNSEESFTRYATPEHLDSIPIKLMRYYEKFSIVKNEVTNCVFRVPNILLAPRCNKRNIPIDEWTDLSKRYPNIFN